MSLVQDWRVSMMAYSFIDPLWKAKVRSETLRLPDHRATTEKKCARRHAPVAVTEATFDGAAISIFDDDFVDQHNPYRDLAVQGVSCTLCHQIPVDNLGTDDSFSGGGDTITYQIDALTGSGYTVLVELRDQTMAYPFLKDLFNDSQDDLVAVFESMYADPAISKGSEVIDTLNISVDRHWSGAESPPCDKLAVA